MKEMSANHTQVSNENNFMISMIYLNNNQENLNPMLKKEIFDLIDKIYFNDFSVHTQTTSFDHFKDTSDYELHKQAELVSATSIDDASYGVLSAEDDSHSNDTGSQSKKSNGLIEFNKLSIKNRAKKLQIEQDVVCRKVSDIILENSKAFSVELQRVSEFKYILEDSYQICSIARRSFYMAEYSFLMPSLKLVKKQVKKQNLIKLLTTILEIKYFNDSINQIIDLIQNKEWPSAINMCFKVEKEITKYQNLNCIKDLKKKTSESYLLIEESLSENLSKLVITSNLDIASKLNKTYINQQTQYFDEVLFGKIFTAYFRLEKITQFFDKIYAYLLQSINIQLHQTLLYTLISTKINQQPDLSNKEIDAYIEDIKRKDIHGLFKLIRVEDYKRAISDVCLNLFSIMKNYYRICVWISNNYLANDLNVINTDMIITIEKKLHSGLSLVWKEVQQRTSQLFRSMCFDNFKFDEFIQILTILHKLVEFGNEFCSTPNATNNPELTSKVLLLAVKDQTLAYLRAIHILNLEELKMFLENEIWQWCPVESNFSIFNLNEYKFLKDNKNLSKGNNVSMSIQLLTNEAEKVSVSPPLKFEINPKMIDLLNTEEIDPFEDLADNEKNESSLNSSRNKVNGDGEYDEKEGELVIDGNSPILTNTTLNIIRLFGKYMHMLSIFQIISNQVIDYLIQLYNFYFYYIYLDFAHEELGKISSISVGLNNGNSNESNNNNNNTYAYLQTIIKNIKNDLFVNSKYNITEPVIQSIKVPSNRQDYIGCINQRIVAVESLIFLSKQLENLFPLIEIYLPSQSSNGYAINKQAEYSKILSEITSKIQSPIYLYVARYAIDYSLVIDSIVKINWDLSEILSQHNPYVEMLLRQIKQFQQDIESLKEQGLLPPLNKKIVYSLLGETLKLVMKILVDGYASVKKCSNEGRALMQLDFQQLVVKLEKTCGSELRPLPHKEYVEAYIKAYYLPDSVIEKWIKEHPEYQQKHIVGLIGSMAQVTKKTRLNINASIFINNTLNKENGSNKENVS